MQLPRPRYSLLLLLVLSVIFVTAEDAEENLFDEVEEDEDSSTPERNTPAAPAPQPPMTKLDRKTPAAPAPQPPMTIIHKNQDGVDEARQEPIEDPEDAFVWPTTEQEMRAEYLPDEHHCNGCKGIAFQIDKALNALMPLNGPKRSLAEHEYMEAMECRTSVYDDYGLKKLEDRTRVLTGPGLQYDDYKGSKFGGAKWPGRMARFCGSLVGDLGEEEVYRLWTESSQDGSPERFSEALCGPSCGAGPRRTVRKKEEDEEEEEEKPKKKKAKKKPKKEEDSFDGPLQAIAVSDKKQLVKMVNKKHKFVFLLFCAPSFKRCVSLTNEFEKAARAAKKEPTFKDVRFAIANSDEVGTFDFVLDRDILPAFLLFRRGYAKPKGIKADDMLKLREAGDFLNYMHTEIDNYMQDDTSNFPRGKLEL